MQKSRKPIWKAVADIPQNTIFMMGYPIKSFFEDWPKLCLGNKITKYFTYFKGDFSQMIYLAQEFDAQAEFMAKKMFKNPQWALDILKRIEESATAFFLLMRSIKQLPLRKMANQQIANLLVKVGKVHRFHHGIGASLSWHADAGKEMVTQGLQKIIKEKYLSANLKPVFSEVFSVITTPLFKEGFLEKEEKSFLTIAQAIRQKRKLKKTFIQSDLDDLVSNLKSLNPAIYRQVINHYQNFAPMTFQYKGPSFPLSDYVGRLQAFFRDNLNPEKMLKQSVKQKKRLKKQQRQFLAKLQLNKYEQDLIRMAQQMVFVKDYRKNSLYHGMYYYEMIFKEAARRLNLSLNQVWVMSPWEIIAARKTQQVDENELNQRQKFAAVYWYRRGHRVYNVIYSGLKAKSFYKKIALQKVKQNLSELKGTCAYPGKVRGIVKIVNVPSEINKMIKGDIMVAQNTNPNLVPAMKKASALIGAAGGLTCHTAIVAREMKIPCVVGVQDCDKILKDGDKVEVDATSGVVKNFNY